MNFLLLTLLATISNAAVTPTAPSTGESYNVGAACPYQYTVDPTGTWKNMSIDLMTGDNFNMVTVTNVASGVDGTTGNGMGTWTCPSVFPNAAIYFYQFSNGELASTDTWTTRFTIAAVNGGSSAPTNATQPSSGAAIPWGTGKLVNASNSTSSASSPTTLIAATSTTPIASVSLTSSASTVVKNATTSMITSMISNSSSTATSTAVIATSTKSSADKKIISLSAILLSLVGLVIV